MNEVKVEEIIERHGSHQSSIVAILQDIQHEYSHLPREILFDLSRSMNMPISQIYSLATFYKTFSLKPRGKHQVSVCMGTACHVKGGQRVLEKVERDLNVKTGETSSDMRFSLEAVRCLGCCGLAPVVTVGDDLYSKVSLTKVSRILKKYT
ncbi:MAG: NAD(P)H-dependent oxidoreductase subunit E [Fidelibacterota bacterium]